MAACQVNFPVISKPNSQPSTRPSPSTNLPCSHLSSTAPAFAVSLRPSHSHHVTLTPRRFRQNRSPCVVLGASKPESLKVMISGAPASGKGTQCEFITKKYGLVHIAAGDLLREEVAGGSKNGKLAKEYMGKGRLVPDEIVVKMVKDRLSQPDSQESGWLLDGYPRSSSQASALMELGFQPDLFILLNISEDILVERVVGRRLDPVTGRIYHLKYFPPETDAIAARLTQRFDDTEEKVKLRLRTHHQNVEAVLSLYKDVTVQVNGNDTKEAVFAQIDSALTQLLAKKRAPSGSIGLTAA